MDARYSEGDRLASRGDAEHWRSLNRRARRAALVLAASPSRPSRSPPAPMRSSTGRTRTPKRSGAPTSTARASTTASSPARLSPRGGGRRRAHLLDERNDGTDRACRSRRHERRTGLHHRCQRPHRCGGRRQLHLLGERFAGTIGRAEPRRYRTSTRASSRRQPSPTGWRSTAATSTGRTSTAARSGAPTSTARTSTRVSSPPPTPAGVAVDGAHVYWANAGTQHDRTRQPRRLERRPELHQRRRRAPGGGGRRRPCLLGEFPAVNDTSDAPSSTGRANARRDARPDANFIPVASPPGSRSTRWPAPAPASEATIVGTGRPDKLRGRTATT